MKNLRNNIIKRARKKYKYAIAIIPAPTEPQNFNAWKLSGKRSFIKKENIIESIGAMAKKIIVIKKNNTRKELVKFRFPNILK